VAIRTLRNILELASGCYIYSITISKYGLKGKITSKMGRKR
jgi:hypothetical protein